MNDATRRNVERQLQLNRAQGNGTVPEAHLRASVINKAYGSWANLFKNHTDILENDIKSLYPKGVKVVIDKDR